MRSQITLSIPFVLLLAACGSSEAEDTPSSAAAPTTPVEVPAEPAAAQAPATQLTAAPISVPLHELEKEHLEAALRAGGWEIGTSSATRSSMYAVTTHATRDGVRAVINYYRNGGDFWRRRLERDQAAIHADDEHEVLLGVTIESNRDAQQGLLDSLLPAPQ